MISVNLSASFGATGCHITCVDENPCSSNSGGPLPPTRAKMRPDLVLIHSAEYPGNRSASSGMSGVLRSWFDGIEGAASTMASALNIVVVAAGTSRVYAIGQA